MRCADQAPGAEHEVEGAKGDPVAAPVESSREVDPVLALTKLIARVCTAQRIREAELRRGSRCRPVSLARATIAYLAFHELGVSLADTARLLGVSRQALWARLEDGRRAASRLPL